MALWLILLFFVLPIIEIALFVEVGGAIGLLPTLAIIFLTALLGVAIMRWQGLRALDRLRASMESGADPGSDPVGPMAHGALILVAGGLLVLPGFFTDCVGLLLLLPPVRSFLIRRGASRVTVQAATYVRRSGPRPGTRPPPETIEADYEVVEEAPPPRNGGSGWTRRH
ncbi:FxsA family protein [Amaricoccus sp.]|uniref:FxsA family protein n=1 Tax=Amaricoccus sp. TaxID=1872485 RepID=UPI0026303CB9|nr:FxsA family protein [Amaricoccus sp.]HRO10912.1 FxsA family protein [Amaricoccus sp.]